MNFIQFEDAIKLIDSGELVKLEYVSLDRKRITGGKLRLITGRVTVAKSERKQAPEMKMTGISKRNHYDNFTRLIRVYMGNRETATLKPVHLPLITKINDKRMLL